MIDIRIAWKDEPFALRAIGHAGVDRSTCDHDLVCCAASTIIQMLAVSCAQVEGISTRYHAVKEKALEEILITGTEAHWDELVPRFQMAIDGLTLLANQYPQNVSLLVEE